MSRYLPVDPEVVTKYLKTVGYKLLVMPDRVKNETDSGIVLYTDYDGSGDLRQASVGRGTVMAIGPMAWQGIKGYDYNEGGDWCKVGDHIIFAKYSGKFVEDPYLEDPDDPGSMMRYALIHDEDVQAVIDDDMIETLKKENS